MDFFHDVVVDDDDDSLPPNRLCLVNKDFNTPFSCSMTRILKINGINSNLRIIILNKPDLSGHRFHEE
jgi:hypothetical protein